MIDLESPDYLQYFPEDTVSLCSYQDVPHPRYFKLMVRVKGEDHLRIPPWFPSRLENMLEMLIPELTDNSDNYYVVNLSPVLKPERLKNTVIYTMYQTTTKDLKERLNMQKLLNLPLIGIFEKVCPHD